MENKNEYIDKESLLEDMHSRVNFLKGEEAALKESDPEREKVYRSHRLEVQRWIRDIESGVYDIPNDEGNDLNAKLPRT